MKAADHHAGKTVFRLLSLLTPGRVAIKATLYAISILDGELLSGSFPLGKTRLVQAWIEINRESLLADWELAVSGQLPLPIDPLR